MSIHALFRHYPATFGVERSTQCADCGGFLMIGTAGRQRCAGCALLDMATWQFTNPSGCWSWCGARNGKYGVISVAQGQSRGTHRVAFATWTAPILPFWDVLHTGLCDGGDGNHDLACCNPDHLRLGKQAERMGTTMSGFALRAGSRRGRYRPGGWRVWGDNCEVLF